MGLKPVLGMISAACGRGVVFSFCLNKIVRGELSGGYNMEYTCIAVNMAEAAVREVLESDWYILLTKNDIRLVYTEVE